MCPGTALWLGVGGVTSTGEKAMKKIRTLAMGLAVLLLTAGLAAAQCKPAGCSPKGCGPKGCSPQAKESKEKGKEKTLTGVVSDSACGRKHTMMPGKSDAVCTRECVKMGSKFALVVGDKVYTLEGGSENLDKLAGEKAKVKGTVSGNTVQVASVMATK